MRTFRFLEPNRFFKALFKCVASLSLVSCIQNTAELGTEKNPIKLHFVPSVDAKVIESNSKVFKEILEKETGYKFDITIPQSYIAIVEAFGTKKADVAAMNTFGYLLARDKYGVEARLRVVRHDLDTYQSMFVAKADSNIKSVRDLNGKKIAYVDPASTTGYILPLKALQDQKVNPKETVFALKHDNVISMVYQGQVDAGAAYYSPAHKNDKGEMEIEDARRLVLTQYPDVEKKIVIIGLSESVPNDPFIFRKDLSEEMKIKITDAMIKLVTTKEGIDAFRAIYGATGVKKTTDSDYDMVRDMLKAVGKSSEELMRK